jgi:hypothetical protein
MTIPTETCARIVEAVANSSAASSTVFINVRILVCLPDLTLYAQ